jgi:hypothetical protein
MEMQFNWQREWRTCNGASPASSHPNHPSIPAETFDLFFGIRSTSHSDVHLLHQVQAFFLAVLV